MLSNLIIIYGEHGHLITRSLFDDKLILKLNEGEKTTISSSLQKKIFPSSLPLQKCGRISSILMIL